MIQNEEKRKKKHVGGPVPDPAAYWTTASRPRMQHQRKGSWSAQHVRAAPAPKLGC
jgi:hypothetical protein